MENDYRFLKTKDGITYFAHVWTLFDRNGDLGVFDGISEVDPNLGEIDSSMEPTWVDAPTLADMGYYRTYPKPPPVRKLRKIDEALKVQELSQKGYGIRKIAWELYSKYGIDLTEEAVRQHKSRLNKRMKCDIKKK